MIKQRSWLPSNRWAVVLLVTLCCSVGIQAQDDVTVEAAKQRGPYYVGVGTTIQFTVRGLETKPDPTCEVINADPAIQASVAGISPRIMQQVYQSGGRIRRIQQVTYVIQMQVIASRAGQYSVGPFVIRQDGVEKQVDPIEMTFESVPATDQMRVALELPEIAYPDQRVKVKLRWAVTSELSDIQSLHISSPVFDQFRFAPDPPGSRQSNKLPVQTPQGSVAIPAEVSSETIDGKEFTVLTAERTLIPDRPGEFELDPISATIRVVTQWQRQRSGLDDFGFGGSLLEEAFGGRSRPMEVKLYRAEGKPHRFQVKPFPSADRPESFAGAVGSGFTLDVAADRTVVRAGDPIRLTIDIRGDGNLENATLPSLFADGGLSKDQFRVPEGDVPGVFDPDTLTKTFEVLVRVEDENIDELPALRYSWFDPNNETYQTTLSSPIALRVNPASMVTADAVVSSGARKRTDGNTTDQTMETVDLGRASSDGISPSQVLSGVDLSLTTDANRLLAAPSGLLASGAFQGSVYVIAALCLIWMMVGKQRKQSDPAERQAKTLATQLGQQIQSAASMNAKTGAAQIAEALRSALRELDAVDREAIQVTIAKCEAIEFRPDPASQSTLDPALIDEAARHLP